MGGGKKIPQKHFAVFLPGLYGGGAERTMLNLVHGLSSRGYDIDLVLSSADGPYFAEASKSLHPTVLNARTTSHRRTLASLPALASYLRERRPIALLSALTYANIVALWARKLASVPVRVVVSEQNTISESNGQMPIMYRHILPRLVRYFYPWADAITTVSKGVADDLAHTTAIPRKNIRVIHNPVVTPDLHSKARQPLEHPWFGRGEPPVLLAIGRLVPQKDYPTLIRAFASVRTMHPARLLILGEGPERSRIEALVAQLNLERDVDLAGFVVNPYAYLARASVFVLTSRWEGLPTVLIEALYCGVPVVATDCRFGPREILADGRFGRLVAVGDADAVAQAIENTLTGKIACAASESWQPFRLEVVVDQYVELLCGN